MSAVKTTKKLENEYKKNKVTWKDTLRISDKYPFKLAEKITDIEKISGIKTIKKIMVFNDSIIKCMEFLTNIEFKPLVLISANENYPIENVKYGINSVEYDIYRCSNLNMSIKEELYPLKDLEMIYCPEITIFKTLENKILTPYQVSLILATSVKRPSLISIKNGSLMEDCYSNITEEKKMKKKINNIFKLAESKGFNCLLLTDFGSLEENPIYRVIDMFNEAIKKHSIKYVFFSVNTENFKTYNKFIKR